MGKKFEEEDSGRRYFFLNEMKRDEKINLRFIIGKRLICSIVPKVGNSAIHKCEFDDGAPELPLLCIFF